MRALYGRLATCWSREFLSERTGANFLGRMSISIHALTGTCTVESLGNALATCPLAFARVKIRKKMHVFQAGAKKTSLNQPLEGSHFSSYRQLDVLEYCLGPRGFSSKFSSRKRERAAKKIFKKKFWAWSGYKTTVEPLRNGYLVVCYTAAFSVVTQRSFPLRALRDDTKNGCVTD